VIPEKVEKINHRISPIQDEYIEKYLAEKELNLTATLDGASAYRNADFVVIAAPTNYDPVKNYFDTSHVEEVIDLVLEVNPDAVMVIKSTIPVGYCRSLYVKYAEKFRTSPALAGKKLNLLFSPEFLRESKALYDNLYPSRIIVGFPKLINGRDEENAAIQAIAGDYMSAASFLGISGLVYLKGFDGLIYSIGFLVGWPIILFLVAEQLRNLGKYTFSDVASYRLQQTPIRTLAAFGSLATVALYLIAQMVGAGQLIQILFGLDYEYAVIMVGILMILYVTFGGMLATTWVQIIKAVMLLSGATFMAFMVMKAVGFSFTNMFNQAIGVYSQAHGMSWEETH
jgi:hypothetical protein